MSKKTDLEKALNKYDLLEVRKLMNLYSHRELAMYCIVYLKDRDKLLDELDRIEKKLHKCESKLESYENGWPQENCGWCMKS